MNIVHFLIYVVITFLCTSLGTQLLKKFFRAITIRKISFKDLTQDGGFPSSHTAFSVSWSMISIFSTAYLYKNGSSEELILISAVCAIIAIGNMSVVIRDALGVRRSVQILCDAVKKAAQTNSGLFNNLNLKDVNNETTARIQSNFEDIAKKMNIRSGHLPHEVIGGACWGILVSGATSSYFFGFNDVLPWFILGIILYVICISLFIRYSSVILNWWSNPKFKLRDF